MRPRIYISPPEQTGEELKFLQGALRSNWLAPVGPDIDAFEAEFCDATGVEHALAICSGTAALHLALRVLGVGPGDSVVCSTLTFIASAAPIVYLGASPIFVDSEELSWNMDPRFLERKLSEMKQEGGRMPKAAIVVDLYGQCARYDEIEEICRLYDVPIVEDAAESLGAEYQNRKAGRFGKLAAFSFNGNKIVTTSGGGMLVSDDGDLIDQARRLASHAREPRPYYQHQRVGYNYGLSNILAAMGRAQLKTLEERVTRRRKNFELYRRFLADCAGLRFMPELPECRSTRWLTCLEIDSEAFRADREEVRQALEAENIEARPVWKPLHLQPVFSDRQIVGGSVSERLFANGLCLPSGGGLTAEDIERISGIVLARRGGQIGAEGGPVRDAAGMPASTTPDFGETAPEATSVDAPNPIRDEEALGRNSAAFSAEDDELIACFRDKRILVTGAGGSIGSELTRQLSGFSPDRLILLDRDENSLYEIGLEIEELHSGKEDLIIADVRDRRRLERVFQRFQPEIIFHAAAYKHVPMMEANPSEAVMSNVLGTKNLVELAVQYEAGSFILVSTDKAVNPTSVMGASKRVAELILQKEAGSQSGARFCAVRFGNVLGSRGSVLRVFQKRISEGLSLQVTHPEMTRYFMTIPEAVHLVIQAGSLGNAGDLFVLDMGRPVRIVDLAHRMADLAGTALGKEIAIEIIGERPGEKLAEELLSDREYGIRSTKHPRILVIQSDSRNHSSLDSSVSALLQAAERDDADAIYTAFHNMGIGYRLPGGKADLAAEGG